MRMTPTVCVFNRTRESFLCLSAAAAGGIPAPPPNIPGFRPEVGPDLKPAKPKLARDGIWLAPAPAVYTVGTISPVDRVYLDGGNRVIHLIEHLDPLQMV